MKPLAEQIYEEIEQTLRQHRLSRWQCEDGEGAYPLTDILTPDGESIQAGYDEIRMICDSIYNRVLTKHFISAEKSPDVFIIETWNGMPDGHSGFLKSWGYVQFGKRLIEKVLPRLTKRPPRAWMRLGPTGESTGVTDVESYSDQWKRVGARVIPLYTEVVEDPLETQLMKFYDAGTPAELIATMQKHIAKMQERLPATPSQFTGSPRHG